MTDERTGGQDSVDVVVLGAGSGGEYVAGDLADAGWSVALVERAYVGGECPFLACVPSKALLLAARRGATWADAVRGRDAATSGLDDSAKAEGLAKRGVRLVRGDGRVVAPGRVEVRTDADPVTLTWRRALVVGTGSRPTRPPIRGLADVATWTSDQALTSPDLPGRLAVLGGGAVGCELAQVFSAFGSRVVLVESADHLLPAEPWWAGETLAEALRAGGVDVRTGTTIEDARDLAADRVLLATGRTPLSTGLGLEHLGLHPEDGEPLAVDGRCRIKGVSGDVFAVGDVTGVAGHTHSANYQARIVVAELTGTATGGRPGSRDADYHGVPRAVYTDPAVISAGLTADAARKAGHDVRTARFEIGGTARAFLERTARTSAGATADDGPGAVELVADARTGILLGGCAVGPDADSWGGQLVLAVRARLDVATLADHVDAFPTWSEAIGDAARDLARRRTT